METTLKESTIENITRFSLEGVETEAKVVYVYDGDTCDVVFVRQIGQESERLRYKCRLADIDAVELKTRKGRVCRNYLAHLCLGKSRSSSNDDVDGTKVRREIQNDLNESKSLVYAKFGKFDKYGRLLATIQKTENSRESFNKLLIKNGLAVAYK